MADAGPSDLCVLAEPYLSRHQVRSLEYAVAETGVDVRLVVVNDPEDPDYDPDVAANAVNDRLGLDAVRLFLRVLDREGAWAFVIAEKKLTEQLGLSERSSGRVRVEDVACFADADVECVTPEQDGNWNMLPAETVERVGEACDLVLRYGFGLVKGDVLTEPEYGVLSFHPADVRRYRGLGPPQAFLDGREEVGVTLQRLNENIDGGEIVAYRDVDVRECATLWDVYDEIHEVQVELLAAGIRNLRDPDFEPTVPDTLGPYYSIAKRRDPEFAGRVLAKNVCGHLERQFEYSRR